MVTDKYVTAKCTRINLSRKVLVVGERLVALVPRNVIELFVRWIMWWDDLAVLIAITITVLSIIPHVVCSGGAFSVTPEFPCNCPKLVLFPAEQIL